MTTWKHKLESIWSESECKIFLIFKFSQILQEIYLNIHWWNHFYWSFITENAKLEKLENNLKFEKLVPASKPKYFFSYTRKCSGQNTELGIKKEAYVYPYIYSIHIFRDKSTDKDYFDNPI